MPQKEMSMDITSFPNSGPFPEHLNVRFINMWTRDSIHPALFYRTGFESIFFNHDRQYALSCVLSSVVPVEKEIVIAGENHLDEVIAGAEQFEIPNIVLDATPDEIPLVKTFLTSRTNVSHLILVVGYDDDRIEKYIRHIRPVLDLNGIDLVLYCTASVERIHDRTNGGVDYMIGGWDESPDNSFVVARRNKLVQTEGNSRLFNYDLYASWQWSLRARETNIVPMEM
jgi:hypothetical protein